MKPLEELANSGRMNIHHFGYLELGFPPQDLFSHLLNVILGRFSS
ncbi:MAG TPA: hypothetical protein VN377_03230 [Candidatus Thermoplasmatota archaeon]|nr:hypothetical protein [Candidatus Thermoplasmatota archaeon]